MCVCVPKYNVLSVYNVVCMYVFRADHLTLDNQSVCSSLGKATSLAPNFPQLPRVPCAELRLCGISLVPFDMTIGVILAQVRLVLSCW